MNREEFIVSAAIILFLAFLLGWLSRWLLQRLNMVSEKDLNQFNKISAALHEAEENNEKARVRELELNKKVSQLEAELGAAMDGLRAARLETEELKSASSEKKRADLDALRKQAVEVRAALETGNHTDVGQLLDASWQIKRSLVDGITGDALDDLYSAVMELGTSGGKLLGAGGGGFFLFQGSPEIQSKLEDSYKVIPLVMDTDGSTIIFDDGSRI